MASTVVALALMRYAWPRRTVRAVRPFLFLTAAAAVWSLLASFQVLVVGLEGKALFSNLRFIAISTLPVAWIAFALAYTGRSHWLAPRRLIGLMVIPLVTMIMTATNAEHSFMIKSFVLSEVGPIPGLERTFGAWFWIHVTYSYGMMTAGGLLIVFKAYQSPTLYRRQAILMLIGVWIAFLMNIMFLLAPHWFAYVDLTPVSFTISSAFFAWGLFRYHLLDLMPVARATIVDTIPDAVIVVDGQSRVVDLNPSACALLKCDDAIGRAITSLIEPQEITWPKESITKLVSREISLMVDDERRYFEWRIAPLHGADDDSTNHLIVTVLRDITDRRRATLFEVNQKQILELIAKGSSLSDILIALARFVEDLASTRLCCSILLVDDDGKCLRHGAAPSLPESYNQAVDGTPIGPNIGSCGTAAFLGTTVVVTDIASDPLWVNFRDLALKNGLQACWSTPIFSSDERILGTFALYHYEPHKPAPEDLHLIEMATHLAGIAIERRLFEHEMVNAKDRAEEMARLKSAFLANMSHEIRTPLTSIIGFADILADELSDDYQELAAHIGESGNRLLETLNSVLDYARLEAGKMDLHCEVLCISHIVRETASLFLPQTTKKGLALELVIEAPQALARLDHALFIRILNNLIGNALKFTDEGSITLSVVTDDRFVYLEVGDSGRGIGESFLPHLFEEFQQESTGLTRSHQGSGLGLKITKRLVELMDGTISVASQQGVGSTFTLTFPRATETTVVADLPPQRQHLSSPRPKISTSPSATSTLPE